MLQDLRDAWKGNSVASKVQQEIAIAVTGHGGPDGSSYDCHGGLSDVQLVVRSDEYNSKRPKRLKSQKNFRTTPPTKLEFGSFTKRVQI